MIPEIKWGVLGCAQIAENSVIPAIIKGSNSDFYAVASRDPEKLKRFQGKFHCQKIYFNYDDLLDDPEVQAVYIPLPNGVHKEWTIKAARKGKHVLCEKPIALHAEDTLEMIKECDANKVKLMEAFMYRYTDRTRKVQDILNSGVLGEVKYINSQFRFFLDHEDDYRWEPTQGGGSLYDVGCYPLNFTGMVTGCAPVAMKAEYRLHKGVDSAFSAILTYENGIIANINCGFNAFFRVYSEIVGTQGVLEVPDTFLGNAGTITLITAGGRESLPVKESDRYRMEIEDFSAAILENRPPLFSLEETVRNMKIIDQLLDMTYRKGC